jgi:hypothetical protein
MHVDQLQAEASDAFHKTPEGCVVQVARQHCPVGSTCTWKSANASRAAGPTLPKHTHLILDRCWHSSPP